MLGVAAVLIIASLSTEFARLQTLYIGAVQRWTSEDAIWFASTGPWLASGSASVSSSDRLDWLTPNLTLRTSEELRPLQQGTVNFATEQFARFRGAGRLYLDPQLNISSTTVSRTAIRTARGTFAVMPLGFKPPTDELEDQQMSRTPFSRVANETGWLELLGNSTLANRFRDAINGSTPAINGTGWEWLIGEAFQRRRAGPNGTFSSLPQFTADELEALAVLAAAGDPAAFQPREGPNGTVLPPLVNQTTDIPPLLQQNASGPAPHVPIVIEGVPVVFSAVQVLQCESEDLSASGPVTNNEEVLDDDAVGQGDTIDGGVDDANSTAGGGGSTSIGARRASNRQSHGDDMLHPSREADHHSAPSDAYQYGSYPRKRLQSRSGDVVYADESTASGNLLRCLTACRGTFQPTSGSGNDVATGLCTTYWRLSHACIVVSHARPTRIDDTAATPGCAVLDEALGRIGLAGLPVVFDSTTNLGPFGYSLIDIVRGDEDEDLRNATGSGSARRELQRGELGSTAAGLDRSGSNVGEKDAAEYPDEAHHDLEEQWFGLQPGPYDLLTEEEAGPPDNQLGLRQLQDDGPVVVYRQPPITVDLSRVSLTVRSNRDPYVAALRLSRGTLTFGTEPQDLVITALSLFLAGVLVCFAPLGLLYCAVVCCLLGDRRSIEEAPASFLSLEGQWGRRKALGNSSRRYQADLDWRETILFMRQGDILGAGEALARNLRGVIQQVAMDVGQLGAAGDAAGGHGDGMGQFAGSGADLAMSRRGSELMPIEGRRGRGSTMQSVAAAAVAAQSQQPAGDSSIGVAGSLDRRRTHRAGTTVDDWHLVGATPSKEGSAVAGGAAGVTAATKGELDEEGIARDGAKQRDNLGGEYMRSTPGTMRTPGVAGSRHSRAATMMSPDMLGGHGSRGLASELAGPPPGPHVSPFVSNAGARRQLERTGGLQRVQRGSWAALDGQQHNSTGKGGSGGSAGSTVIGTPGAVMDASTAEILAEAPMWALPSGELLRAGGVSAEGARHLLAPWSVAGAARSGRRAGRQSVVPQPGSADGRRVSHDASKPRAIAPAGSRGGRHEPLDKSRVATTGSDQGGQQGPSRDAEEHRDGSQLPSFLSGGGKHGRSRSVVDSAHGTAFVRRAASALRRAAKHASHPSQRMLNMLIDNAAARAHLGIVPAIGGGSCDLIADRGVFAVETHGRLSLVEETGVPHMEARQWRRQEWRELLPITPRGNDAQGRQGWAARARFLYAFAKMLGWSGVPRVVSAPQGSTFGPSMAWSGAQERSIHAISRLTSMWYHGKLLHPLDLPIGSSWVDAVAQVQKRSDAGAKPNSGRHLLVQMPHGMPSPQRSTGLVLGVSAWEGAADFVLAVAGSSSSFDAGRLRTLRAASRRLASARGQAGDRSTRRVLRDPVRGRTQAQDDSDDSDGSILQNPDAPRMAGDGAAAGMSYLARRPVKQVSIRSPQAARGALASGRLQQSSALGMVGASASSSFTPVQRGDKEADTGNTGFSTGPRESRSPMDRSVGAESAVEHDSSVPRGLAGTMKLRQHRGQSRAT